MSSPRGGCFVLALAVVSLAPPPRSGCGRSSSRSWNARRAKGIGSRSLRPWHALGDRRAQDPERDRDNWYRRRRQGMLYAVL